MKKRTFSGFSVALKTDSKRKQRLSNHLKIEIDTDRTSVSSKLNLREARALQKWLNDNIPVATATTQSS